MFFRNISPTPANNFFGEKTILLEKNIHGWKRASHLPPKSTIKWLNWMLRPYLTYGALAQPWAACEVTDLTVYRVSLLPGLLKHGPWLKAWLLKYAANLSHTFQQVVQSEVNGSECVQAAGGRKKANLGDFPVSYQAAEAKVMFTWVTHDKTREAKSQEQTGANLIFGVCVYA